MRRNKIIIPISLGVGGPPFSSLDAFLLASFLSRLFMYLHHCFNLILLLNYYTVKAVHRVGPFHHFFPCNSAVFKISAIRSDPQNNQKYSYRMRE